MTDIKDSEEMSLGQDFQQMGTFNYNENNKVKKEDDFSVDPLDFIDQKTPLNEVEVEVKPDFMTEELALQLAPPPPTDEEVAKADQRAISIKTGQMVSPVGSGILFEDVKYETIFEEEKQPSEYVFEWNRKLKKLREEKAEDVERAGGEEKYKQKLEQQLVEIKRTTSDKAHAGQYGAWGKAFNDYTFGYGIDLAIDTAMAIDYFATGLDARATDVVEMTMNAYKKTDDFFNGNFLSIPGVVDFGDVIEGTAGNFLFKSRDYTKKPDKNPEEYADKFMDFFYEMFQLAEVGLIGRGTQLRKVDIFGADQVKLFPNRKIEDAIKKQVITDINRMEKNVIRATKAHNNIRKGKIFTSTEYDFNAFAMKRAASESQDKLDAKVALEASEAHAIRKNLIENFENNLSVNKDPDGKTKSRDRLDYIRISYEDENGNTQLDYEKARELGTKTLRGEDLENLEQSAINYLVDDPNANPFDPINVARTGTSFLRDLGKKKDKKEPSPEKQLGQLLASLSTDIGSITSPVLNPEKFNSIVALANNLQKKKPELFDKDKSTIDNLFELAVRKDFDGEELIDELDKVGLSFEDYVLSVVGSGSTSGKILQKLSMIKRSRSVNEMIGLQDKNKTMQAHYNFYRAIRRLENARRGGLVTQIATAARNLITVGVRYPLESLGNVVETGLYNATKPLESSDGFKLAGDYLLAPARFGLSLADLNNWKGSTRSLRMLFQDERIINPVDSLMYGRLDLQEMIPFVKQKTGITLPVPVAATTRLQEVVDFFLKRPEFQEKHNRLFNNLNDIQKVGGREEIPVESLISNPKAIGGFALNMYEDLVYSLNFFNRQQEHMIRRTAFFGELERLLKREWNLDLLPTLNDVKNEGLFRKLINDSPELKPKGSRSIMELMEDATEKALDVSYSEGPDLSINKFLEQTLVKSVAGTIILPFPRFALSQMELMATYTAGALIPATKHLAHLSRLDKLLPINDKKLGDFRSFRDFSKDDRERIARNSIGLPILYGAYEYLTSTEDENGNIGELNKIPVPDAIANADPTLKSFEKKEIDITPNHPILPNLLVANMFRIMRRSFDPSKSTMWNVKNANWDEELASYFRTTNKLGENGLEETVKVLLGTNVRVGSGAFLFDDLVRFASGTSDVDVDQRVARMMGRLAGNLVNTLFVPFNQFMDAERGMDARRQDIPETMTEQTLSFWETMKAEYQRSRLTKPGFSTISAEEERGLERKIYLYEPEQGYQRDFILYKFVGLNIVDEKSEVGEYLTRLGIDEFKLMSSSRSGLGYVSPEALKIQKQSIKDHLQEMLPVLKDKEKEFEAQYDGFSSIQKSGVIGGRGPQSKVNYVNTEMRHYIKNMMTTYRREILSPKINEATQQGRISLNSQMINAYKNIKPQTIKMRALNTWKRTIGVTEDRDINFGDANDLIDILLFSYIQKDLDSQTKKEIEAHYDSYRKLYKLTDEDYEKKDPKIVPDKKEIDLQIERLLNKKD